MSKHKGKDHKTWLLQIEKFKSDVECLDERCAYLEGVIADKDKMI
jgi:hypothetical protein